MTPTVKTLKLARSIGGTAHNVEKWNCFARIRQDLLGMFDILWLNTNGLALVGIQTSSRSHHGERVKKLRANPLLEEWKKCGGVAEVWTWSPGSKYIADDVKITVL